LWNLNFEGPWEYGKKLMEETLQRRIDEFNKEKEERRRARHLEKERNKDPLLEGNV
jgi:hypothetical protein